MRQEDCSSGYNHSIDCKHWFALQVKFRHERVVAQALESKGFQSFSPTYPAFNSSLPKPREVDHQLFPGYVFGRFDPRFRLGILTTPGVQSVVGYARVPVPIDPDEIRAIQDVVKARLTIEPSNFLECGRRVRIVKGPLAGVEGLLLETRSSCRVVLSVSLIQRSIRIEVDPGVLAPVDLKERYCTDAVPRKFVGV